MGSDVADPLDNVSRETHEKLVHYCDLLARWTKTINLIAPATVPDIWDRHIKDSAQLARLAPERWDHWIDLGSGGGLPAIVIAILDDGRQPVTLVESDVRKCLFLNTVRRELDLNIIVKNTRIESLEAHQCDILTARALAPLSQLLDYAENLLKPTGSAFFLKGERFQEELDQAAKEWQFTVSDHKSITNSQARILEISGIHRREH